MDGGLTCPDSLITLRHYWDSDMFWADLAVGPLYPAVESQFLFQFTASWETLQQRTCGACLLAFFLARASPSDLPLGSD